MKIYCKGDIADYCLNMNQEIIQRERYWIRIGLFSVLFVIIAIQFMQIDLADYSLVGDRTFYRDVLYGFTDKAINEGFDAYYLKKGLPFALINITYTIFEIPKTDSSFLICLFVMNIVSLLLVVFLFFKISTLLKLSWQAEVIGFSIIFYSVHILKAFVLNPVGVDYLGYMVCIFLYWLYLKKKKWTIVFVSFIGAFVDPLIMLIGILLSLVPQKEFEVCVKSLPKKKVLLLNVLKWILIISIIPVLILLTYFKAPSFSLNGLKSLFSGFWYDHNYTSFPVLLLSVLSLMIIIYRMLKPFYIDIIATVKDILYSFRKSDILVIVIMYLLVSLITNSISNGEHAWGVSGLAKQAAMAAVSMPFEVLEAQFRYHGLIVLYVIFCWRSLVEVYASNGYGYFGVICLGIMFMMYPEARYTIDILPYFLFPILIRINNYRIKKSVIVCFILLSILYSRFWYPYTWDNRFWQGVATYQYWNVYFLFMSIAIFFSVIIWLGYKRSWFFEKANL
ncbi:hypothetical protein [Parabacteroides bouchesdurhonensis]|uniref:hypothetical protein n=1 Tax=Parabacteroides bouchesdurhonensis TaxID=1936995 RepID=UPI00131EA34F|nr:hypothetical protein [Parabacteroides bouchesdurhonensis]